MMMRWRFDRPDGTHCLVMLERADTFLSRFLGLLGREPLPERQGLWLLPCASVHSLGMRTAIDVLFVDERNRVVAVRSELAPMRMAADSRAHSVIEMRGGEAARLQIGPGARLRPFDAIEILAGPPVRRFVSIPSQESIMNQNPVPTTRRRSVRPARAAAAAAAAVAAASLASGCASPAVAPETTADAPPVLQVEKMVSVTSVPNPEPGTEDGKASVQEGESTATELVEPGVAEQLYRSARFDESLLAFRGIVAADPDNAHAWLRIGNVLHRKRDWFDALSAYRKAARPQAEAAIREKAVYNIALLNLELARQAMKRLERMRSQAGADEGGPRGAGVGDGALRQLSEQIASGYRDLSATLRGGQESAPGAGRRAVEERPGVGPGSPAQGAALSAEKQVEVEIRQGGGGK